MNKLITYETLRRFTYSNDDICKGEIKGIVLEFIGLGNTVIYNDHTPEGVYFAEKGIIFVHPYCNPWSWMNDQAVAYVDEIIDVLFEKYDLGDDTPIISTGGSMGGQSALTYTAKAKRTPKACVTNCPVCDLVFHFSERPDLPRTLYSAFFDVSGTAEEAIATASPLHLANVMPKVKYVIFHCGRDNAVNIDSHSRKFVDKMKTIGHDVDFIVVPGCGHCALPPDVRAQFYDKVISAIEN